MITWTKRSNDKYTAQVGDLLIADLVYPIKRNGLTFASVSVMSGGAIILHKVIPDVHNEIAAQERANGEIRLVILDALMEIDNE